MIQLTDNPQTETTCVDEVQAFWASASECQRRLLRAAIWVIANGGNSVTVESALASAQVIDAMVQGLEAA
jgi:hypothetical protein